MLIALVYILPVYSDTSYSNPYLDLGIFAFEENDFVSAISHLKRAMLKQPHNPVVYHYLAKTYQKMKRYKEARFYYEQAYNIDPNLDDLLYDRGFFNYLTQKYEAALNDFIQAVKQTPDNLLANYYAGVCAFKTNQYQVALQYFLTCSKQHSNAKENIQYYTAVCYYNIGKPAQAQILFNEIVLHAQSKSLRKNAKDWLKIFKSNPSMFRPYHLYAYIEMTYDDNVKLVPPGETVNDKDDLVIKTFIDGNYNFIQSPILIMGIGYEHFQCNHVDFSDYNIISSIGSFFIKHYKNNTQHSLYIKPVHSWLNNKDYISAQGLEYDIEWKKNRHLKLCANFEYFVTNNFDNNDYDGQILNIDIGMERTIPDNENLTFNSGISIVNENTKGRDQEFQLGQIGCGLRYKNKHLKWDFGGNHYVKNYLHQDTAFQKRRTDRHSKLWTGVLLYRDPVEPYFLIEHQVNGSNIDQYDYKKTAISFGLQYFY